MNMQPSKDNLVVTSSNASHLLITLLKCDKAAELASMCVGDLTFAYD